jgi:hypothetical protein
MQVSIDILFEAKPSLDRFAAAEQGIGELVRSEIDVDAFEVNLSADDEGSQQTERSFFAF